MTTDSTVPLPPFLERIRHFPVIRDRRDIATIERTPWASLALPESTLAVIEPRPPNDARTPWRFAL